MGRVALLSSIAQELQRRLFDFFIKKKRHVTIFNIKLKLGTSPHHKSFVLDGSNKLKELKSHVWKLVDKSTILPLNSSGNDLVLLSIL